MDDGYRSTGGSASSARPSVRPSNRSTNRSTNRTGRSRPRVRASASPDTGRCGRCIHPMMWITNERESTDRPTDGSPEPSHRPSNRNPVGVRSIKTTDRFARPIESISISIPNRTRIERESIGSNRIDRVPRRRSRVSIGFRSGIDRSDRSIDKKNPRISRGLESSPVSVFFLVTVTETVCLSVCLSV